MKRIISILIAIVATFSVTSFAASVSDPPEKIASISTIEQIDTATPAAATRQVANVQELAASYLDSAYSSDVADRSTAARSRVSVVIIGDRSNRAISASGPPVYEERSLKNARFEREQYKSPLAVSEVLFVARSGSQFV
jgi:hypothetical protein